MIKFRRKLLWAKIEGTYATDPTPAAANTMLVENLRIRRLALSYEPRAVVRPYYANEGEIVTGFWSEVSFEVEWAGAGTSAATAPKYGPLLKACGMAETIGADVQYDPVSTAESSVYMYFMMDGKRSKIAGWRGSFSIRKAARSRPKLMFSGIGLHVAETDTALGTADFTGWQKPVATNLANTTTFTVQGYAAKVAEFQFDQNNQVTYRNLPNSESVIITGRRPTGRVTFEEELVAALDHQTNVKAMTSGAIAIVHGTVVANKVKFDAPAVQLTAPDEGESDAVSMLTFELNFLPNTLATGNDDFKLTTL